MSASQKSDLADEDEYDEEADSDFDADGINNEDISASSDDEAEESNHQGPQKKPKTSTQPATQPNDIIELDSGDEATIKEQRKTLRKQQKKGQHVEDASDHEDGAWRARTRAMREREKDEKKSNRLVNIKGSTIDVDKMWEQMNRPEQPLPPPVQMDDMQTVKHVVPESLNLEAKDLKSDAGNLVGDMITIRRKFKFAGEVHTEEKIVPRSSAEARLWMAQQTSEADLKEQGANLVQRPTRKVSRFDPNYNNLSAFKINWTRSEGENALFKGPKLNVVEKSKLDWATHVDAEGLKDELDVHARAKDEYHHRMDFLNQVERRREDNARQARLKG